MNLYIFSLISDYVTGIYTIVAKDELSAKAQLKQDGRNPDILTMECSFPLADSEDKEGISFTLEVEGNNA